MSKIAAIICHGLAGTQFTVVFQKKTAPVELGVKDTNEFTRRSAHTVNYFTLWLDNAPQWKDYPKRSRSFVGSSNFRMARTYGQLYQLFPANDAKIGICPDNDIWFSFGQVPGGDVDDFVILLQNVLRNMFNELAAQRAETDWTVLKRLLKDITTDKLMSIIFSEEKYKYYRDKIPEQFTRYPTILDYFENEITPEKHGFKHATPATYSVTSANDREVWVQGKVALLNIYSIFNNNNNLFPKTSALLAKHNIKNPYNYFFEK